MNDQQKTLNRRDILKLAFAGGATIAAVQMVPAIAESEPEGDSRYRWAMVINQDECIGCGYCTLACKAHNDIPHDITWNRLFETGQVNGETVYLPVPCQHCENAPCVDVCPVKASYHRADGIVMMDYDRCIGCRYCEVACPYGARAFNWREFDGENPLVPHWGYPEIERRPRGVVEKCSFCFHRIDRGLDQGLTPGVDRDATPACVTACPTGARIFGDLNDPDSAVSVALTQNHITRLREDLGTEPRVYYVDAGHNKEECS